MTTNYPQLSPCSHSFYPQVPKKSFWFPPVIPMLWGLFSQVHGTKTNKKSRPFVRHRTVVLEVLSTIGYGYPQ